MSRTSLPILLVLSSCNTQKKKELKRLDQAEEDVREGYRYLGTPRADRTDEQRQRFGRWHPTWMNARVECDRGRSDLGILRVVAMPERCGTRFFVSVSTIEFTLVGLYIEDANHFEALWLGHDPRRNPARERDRPRQVPNLVEVVEAVEFDPASYTLTVDIEANRHFEPSRWSWLRTPREQCVATPIRDLRTSYPVLDASCVIIDQDCDRLVGDVFARCAGGTPLVAPLGPG